VKIDPVQSFESVARRLERELRRAIVAQLALQPACNGFEALDRVDLHAGS